MSVVPVALHVHEQNGSGDSRTAATEMLDAYRDVLGPAAAVGFVGHDSLVRTHDENSVTFDGVEHEVSTSPRRLHVVELPDHDFSYLAHPSETFPDDTRERAMETVRRLGLDGVEKYNAGEKQYEGRLPTLELAGDDAHNPLGAGVSYMKVRVRRPTEGNIMDAIRRGDYTLVNRPGRLRSMLHEVEKKGTLASSLLRGKESVPWESIM